LHTLLSAFGEELLKGLGDLLPMMDLNISSMSLFGVGSGRLLMDTFRSESSSTCFKSEVICLMMVLLLYVEPLTIS
jgi:hypothetical protein